MIKKQFLFSLINPFFISVIFHTISVAAGDVSPLCSDLARFACAPGSYKDGTGEIKSESEISKFMSAYAEESRTILRDRFQKILSGSENSYFKDVAIAGLGLKNSPRCTSTASDDVASCRETLIDGLTTIAQKQALGPLMPQTGLARAGNLRDLEYITQNSAYQKVIRELNNRVQKELGNPEMSKKIQDKVFPKIKELIVARLKQLSIPDVQRNLMISKLNSISFEGTSCEEFGGKNSRSNAEVVSSLLVPNAFYDPSRNTFKLCSGYLLQSTSEFQIATTIAHELTHSIDPCYIARGPEDMGFKYSNSQDLKKMESEYPIKNIIQCLRDSRSVGAQSSGLASPGVPVKTGPYGATIDADGYSAGGSGMQNQPVVKKSFCEGDQIGESVADWMAVEVLPKYIAENFKLTTEQYRIGYANARRLICRLDREDTNHFGFDEHPTTENRINKIILVNPKVRAQMGCPEKHPEFIYCDSEKSLDSSNVQKEIISPAIQSLPAGGVR